MVRLPNESVNSQLSIQEIIKKNMHHLISYSLLIFQICLHSYTQNHLPNCLILIRGIQLRFVLFIHFDKALYICLICYIKYFCAKVIQLPSQIGHEQHVTLTLTKQNIITSMSSSIYKLIKLLCSTTAFVFLKATVIY